MKEKGVDGLAGWMVLICRWLLGVVFLAAGINGYVVFFGFEPFIATSPEAMALFMFDYLLFFEKSLEIICGILLLTNQFVPLSLAALSPIVANILLLHLFVDHSLLALAVLMTGCQCVLLYHYRSNFIRLFERKPVQSKMDEKPKTTSIVE